MLKRIRTIILGLVAVIAVSAPVALTAAPAQAATYEGGDHRSCVTQREWQGVFRGMTRADVTDVFDTRGYLVASYGGPNNRDLYVQYRSCPGFSDYRSLEINFDNYWHSAPGFRLYSKDRYRW